jgi:hypothetical protein
MKRWLERAFRIVRLVAGGICLGLAVHWTLETMRRRRPIVSAFEADTGRPTGLRITPLTPAETDWALLREVLGLRAAAAADEGPA